MTRFRYPRRRPVRLIVKNMIRVAFTLFTRRVHVVGREHVPPNGPLLVVMNHFNFADPAIVVGVVPWPMEFLGGLQFPNAPKTLAWMTSIYGYYQVRRGGVSRDALRAALSVLDQDGVLGIFPEGGSWAAVLRPARPGAAYLAAQSATRLLPVGISGVGDLFPLRLTNRAEITVRFGAPFGPFEITGKGHARRAQLDEVGHEIMRRIAALLPPEQHGVYSDDPNRRAAAQEAAIFPYDDLNG
jgi:1-acyl-sn-glycerol-3-phosphate acyltransferase